MRAVFFMAIVAMSVSPAFAFGGHNLCDRLGSNCQAIYESCLVDAKSMGGTDQNCKNQLAKSKITHSWHGHTRDIDCPSNSRKA